MMRLFLGIEVPEEVKERLHKAIQPIQVTPKGWERSHDYHLTLLFIGEVSQESLPLIRARLGQVKFEPFEIQTRSLEFFNRRVLYLSFEDNQKIFDLKKKIAEVFPEWAKAETKKFIPHVTVKRWQRYEHDELQARIRAHPIPVETIAVSQLALFVSEKDRDNNKYHVIDRSEV